MICWIATFVVAIATGVFVYYNQKAINLQTFLAQKKEQHQKNLSKIGDIFEEADRLYEDNKIALDLMEEILTKLQEMKFPKNKRSKENLEALSQEIDLLQQYNEAKMRYIRNTEQIYKVLERLRGVK